MWEVKTDRAGLHNSLHSYSWYQGENDGGFEGDQNGAGTSCILPNCNTSAFVEAVNAAGRCNFNDWRIPTHQELQSIMHFGVASGPFVDRDYFPHTNTRILPPLWYWTSQPSADGGTAEVTRNAWAIDFANGNDNFLNKSTPARIRLVRGGR